MITVKNKVFTINTKNTSYVMHVRDGLYVENLYYGQRLTEDITGELAEKALMEKFNNPYGNTIAGAGADANLTLSNLNLEMSNAGCGDYRMLPLTIEDKNGCISTRFYFTETLLYEGLYTERDKTLMPYADYDEEDQEKPWTLEVIYSDTILDENGKRVPSGLELRMIYTAFEECDTIVRRSVLINNSGEEKKLRGIASMMLDIPNDEYSLVTFDGLWTRERHKHEKVLESGIYETGSNNGTSSNIHNPFFMVKEVAATENAGNCFAFNLIYSGNHTEKVEVSEYQKLRIMSGINEYAFAYSLKDGETFYSPEATLTFSSKGMSGASANCHKFVTNHIIPKYFRNRPRPILINNWEATYFDFNKHKLVNLAKDAKELGIELFVLDDGWFGERNADNSSLGDWFVNEKKLGGPLSSLISEINALGLQFGIWIEPEMISEKSKLYEAHPDWAVKVPGRDVYIGRNQMILDYTKQEVRDYIVDVIGKILRDNHIEYVKWDMNRPITDAFCDAPGEFFHRYVLGYYDVMKRLTEEFSHVLFEGCSAGGNRFDLGVLSYMPQIWTSDDTDPNERMTIQEGTSYGYPVSTMGAHVSAAPNHQTLRNTSLETRFNVASMGVLGYELDLTSLTSLEKKIIKKQVEFYKKYRDVLQFGEFSRVKKRKNTVIWQATSPDASKAVCLLYKEKAEANQSYDILYATGLIEDATYKVTVRDSKVSIKEFGNLINQVTPVKIKEEGVLQAAISKSYALDSEKEEYTVSGALLMHAGIKLNSRFVGTGLGDGTRVMGDYSSRLYTIIKV